MPDERSIQVRDGVGKVRWSIVRGLESVLRHRFILEDLAQKSGQGAILGSLDYLLNLPYFEQTVPGSIARFLPSFSQTLLTKRTRSPCLVLGRQHGTLVAAVLLFEYRLWGFSTRCYVPLDEDGYRSVIAAATVREELALAAGRYLLRHGAVLALLSFSQSAGLPSLPSFSRALLASQVRPVFRELLLSDTLEDTLAKMSRNTRHNYRRARKQLDLLCRPMFLEGVSPTAAELQELNESCVFTVPVWVAQNRFELSRTAKYGSVVGLRDSDGRWLSLVGGHREDDTFCLDWQINRTLQGTVSVSTAMRFFLIEREIARGTRSLRFERGTTHALQHGFTPESTCDLVFASRLIGKQLAGVFSRSGRGGPLANVLSSPNIIWHRAGHVSRHHFGSASLESAD